MALSLIVLSATSSCREEHPFVVLMCLDGASPDILDELRAEGKLPNLDGLIREGVYGPLESLPARRIMASNPRRGYWSPILWASIATGVVPEKHGIQDFLLPTPGTSKVWMGSEDEEPYAELTLPGIEGDGPFTLELALRSHTPNGAQRIGLVLNDAPLAELEVPVEWEAFSIEIDRDRLRPVRNVVRFDLARQSRPSETDNTSDQRLLAAQLQSLLVRDGEDRVAFELQPVFARFDLGRGFYQPEAKVVEAQSAHLRSRPLWDLLGDRGHPVGVVGYWTTWPAYPVNGFLVSSRMGLRGRRQNTKTDLTWPPELASELEASYPSFDDMGTTFSELRLTDCDPPLIEDRGAIPGVLRQDQLYVRSARRLLPSMDRGFFTVYLESIDVVSHAYLAWKHGAPIREGCRETVRSIVDGTYELVDRWVGELVAELPPDATVVVISDHGLVPAELGGLHSPEGVFIASGPSAGVRRGATFHGGSVLDVAPTVLHLMTEPIPTDMDGKLLAQIFELAALAENAARYVDQDLRFDAGAEVSDEGDDDVRDRLRSIGYIQ